MFAFGRYLVGLVDRYIDWWNTQAKRWQIIAISLLAVIYYTIYAKSAPYWLTAGVILVTAPVLWNPYLRSRRHDGQDKEQDLYLPKQLQKTLKLLKGFRK